MSLFCFFHLECRYHVFINIEIYIQQGKHHRHFSHSVKMHGRDVFFQSIILAKNIHGHHYPAGSYQECTRNKIGAKVGTVPAGAISSCKKPGSNCVNTECNRYNSYTKNFNRPFSYFKLFCGPFPK